MQIRSTTENYYNPNFKYWERTVIGQSKNDTFTYRDKGWWVRFCNYINHFFKDSTKVNVYNWGCSDGEESATFVMQMFSNFPDTAEKFTPVYAKDYDPLAIKTAKEYTLPLCIDEIYDINYYTNNKLDEFLTNIPDYYKQLINMSRIDLGHYLCKYKELKDKVHHAKFSEKYTKYIDYEVSNIMEDYKIIKPKESLVIMRNLLPYLEPETLHFTYFGHDNVHYLLENLSNQMQEKCVIALGRMDLHENQVLNNCIKSFGFEASNVWGVYYKP